MIRNNFMLRQDKKNLSSLKNHQLVETMGYLKPDDLYISDVKYLGVYKMPIVTDDGYILTLPDYVDAALKTGVQEMEVLVLTGANSNDLMRLINFEARPWYRASKSILYKSIKVLQNHLWNTDEGKQWRQNIESANGNDINSIIGYLVGYSGSTISLVKSIGDANYALLDQVDDPEQDMTLTKAQQLVKDEIAQNQKKDNLDHVVHTNLPPEMNGEDDEDEDEEEEENEGEDEDGNGNHVDGDGKPSGKPDKKRADGKTKVAKAKKAGKSKAPCDVSITDFMVGLGRYGDFNLDLKTGRPTILHNDRFAGHVSIVASESNNPDEALHFTMQHIDLNWSFQVIATRITNIVNEEEVSGKQA